ncbi:MAG: S1C family serine protease [Bdellovibrionales bacterium]
MAKSVWGLLFLISVSLAGPVQAHTGKGTPPAAEQETLTTQDLVHGVVKVVNREAEIFTADMSGGHGSGFFVGIDQKTGRGIIFTNKHVIDSKGLTAQSLHLEVNTGESRAEHIPARLAYVSQLLDFAVLEFDPAHIQRGKLRQLGLPTPQSPFYDFLKNQMSLRGRNVMAVGFPFDGSNVTTFGQITGLHNEPVMGPFVQTDTPINPGNSGGPLISLDTGEVIAMNTMTYRGADGYHFSIPIGLLMEEYITWRGQVAAGKSRTIADPKSVTVGLSMVSEGQAKQLGLYDEVEKVAPGYWNSHHSILAVSDDRGDVGLKNDDLILRFNGQVVGGHPFDLRRAVQRADDVAEIEVLRSGKAEKLKVPIANLAYNSKRREVDYVYLSGLLLRELGSREASNIRSGMSHRVFIAGLVPSADVNFRGNQYPLPGSVIASVAFGDKEYKIDNLAQLKKALNQHRSQPFVKIRAYQSNLAQTQEGHVLLRSMKTGAPLIDGVLSTYVVPMREFLTPMQFSINQFRRSFKFSADAGDSIDWRKAIRAERMPTSCESALK